MKLYRAVLVACCALVLGAVFSALSFRGNPAIAASPANDSWYFAVSGDSRDCGDLIMPKIAQSIATDRKEAPVQFYWHLGDLRAIYRFDCDWGMANIKSFQCPPKNFDRTKPVPQQAEYLEAAWPDFIANQIGAFKKANIPFILGLGNHETIAPKTRAGFTEQFKGWLTQPLLENQRQADLKKSIAAQPGNTYFHFVKNGVDLIYLDNSDGGDTRSPDPDSTKGFSTEQLTWLEQILKADESDPSVKTIIVGMHAALPFSISRDHAMDNACSSFCSGRRAYDLLDQAQAAGKHVYVLASHSHFFEQDIYNTREHKDHVLPGWIVGTAGAEQYKPGIRYGYLLVRVKADGTIRTTFEEVGRDSLPKSDNAQLINYCFAQNRRPDEPTATPTPTPKIPLIKDGSFCKCK